MLRKDALASNETYHIYNRGAHKQPIFLDDHDYSRFLMLLYLANNSEPIHMGNLLSKYKGRSFLDIYSEETDRALVDITAYSLMSNHFHVVVTQKAEEGISRFMKKVGTAYSMYFNARHDHSGFLFQGRFKNSLVSNEAYYRWIYAYVHLNPLDLLYPHWEEKGIDDKERARNYMKDYRYSSYRDYHSGAFRPESRLLALDTVPDFLKTQNDLEELLENIKDRPL
ncbi:MAG: transposase [Candidatus Paceibacterota bacterium]